jgi:DNA-binding response OmpR family regulator
MVDRVRGKLAGATDYISKPFAPADLLWTVKRHLNSPAVRARAMRREQGIVEQGAAPAPKRWWQR